MTNADFVNSSILAHFFYTPFDIFFVSTNPTVHLQAICKTLLKKIELY